MFQIPKIKLRHKKVKRRCRDKLPIINDFTINESADAPIAPTRLKKVSTSQTVQVTTPVDVDLSWEALCDENFDISFNSDDDGTNSAVCQNEDTGLQLENQQNVYPEVLWYLISKFVAPEDVYSFALINKAAYACTQRVYFWQSLYTRYCEDHLRLPAKYRIEDNFKKYGLRQRVIRALFHTCNVLRDRCTVNEQRPYNLVGRKCINAWQNKGAVSWVYYIKLKKVCPLRRAEVKIKSNIFDAVGRIDANPEEGCKVLQVTSKTASVLPMLMGLNLTNVDVFQSGTCGHQRLHLGFHSGLATTHRGPPECLLTLDSVVNVAVLDWWHPGYPYFKSSLPARCSDEEAGPMLKENFFDM